VDYLAIYVTLKLALVTTVVLMVIAAPVAYALAYNRFSGKSFLEALIYLPMALPPTVIGFYLIILMGPKGFVGKMWQMLTGGSLLFTFIGITMASIITVSRLRATDESRLFQDRPPFAGIGLCSRFIQKGDVFPGDYSQFGQRHCRRRHSGFSAFHRSMRRFADGGRQYPRRNQGCLDCDLRGRGNDELQPRD
jgi:hypothetical protein